MLEIPEGKIKTLLEELDDVIASLTKPETVKDRKKFAELSKRQKYLSELSASYTNYVVACSDREAALELFSATNDESEKAALADEAESLKEKIEQLSEEIIERLVPPDPDDDKDVIVEIRGAEGGEESNLFAKDLYKMYNAFATKMGWKSELLMAQDSPMGGYDEVIFLLKGAAVWKYLKYEGGPHRVQRVPDTESQGRVHTSSATVSVLPEVDEVEVEIKDSDIEIDVYRSSGPGGQSVNTTDSAVRITHKPTGITVAMQDEKSQLQNRNKAMQVLRSRIYEAEKQRQADERAKQKRGQLKSGGRSDKVRTYNFKDNRVTDHRLGLTLHKLDKVLAGDIDEILEALITHGTKQQAKDS